MPVHSHFLLRKHALPFMLSALLPSHCHSCHLPLYFLIHLFLPTNPPPPQHSDLHSSPISVATVFSVGIPNSPRSYLALRNTQYHKNLPFKTSKPQRAALESNHPITFKICYQRLRPHNHLAKPFYFGPAKDNSESANTTCRPQQRSCSSIKADL